MSVRNGIDKLLGSFPDKVRGFRLGLVANSASVTRDGITSWEALRAAGFPLTCLLAPEHGARLEYGAGRHFSSYFDKELDVEVRSLYDEKNEFGSEWFRDVELIIFDLPHVGCRFYTYIDTLARLLQYSHQSGLPILVLDRPNPIRADIVQGALPLEAGSSAFAPDKIPVRYGLTVAEFARAFAARRGLSPKLSLIQMEGYHRSMWFSQTGLPWVPPSPNMRDLETMELYPGTCLFEGTVLSEGRGTELPFKWFGAPWLDGEQLVRRLEKENFEAVSFEAARITPTSSKHANVSCGGVRLRVTDRESLNSFALVLKVLRTIRELHPQEKLWHRSEKTGRYFIDQLIGDEAPRLALERGAGLNALLFDYELAAKVFAREQEPYFCYDDERSQGRIRMW